jgi:phosphatidylglycerophosphate synthase
MLDGMARRLIDPWMDRAGRVLARNGISADGCTFAGLALGLLAAVAVAIGLFGFALAVMLLGRLADGLDGAVARATARTDRGGFLDITCDFVVYGAVPLGFAVYAPAQNALPAAVLLASFYANGASFLAFAIMAAKRGLEGTQRGPKSLYFTVGLMEGTETILFFVLIMLWPELFPPAAYVFAALCYVTCIARVVLAWSVFRPEPR